MRLAVAVPVLRKRTRVGATGTRYEIGANRTKPEISAGENLHFGIGRHAHGRHVLVHVSEVWLHVRCTSCECSGGRRSVEYEIGITTKLTGRRLATLIWKPGPTAAPVERLVRCLRGDFHGVVSLEMVAFRVERQQWQPRRVQWLGVETHRGPIDVSEPSHGASRVSRDRR